VSGGTGVIAPRRGCCIKLFRKSCSTFTEMGVKAAGCDGVETNRRRLMDAMGDFGAHPYKSSSGLVAGLCNSHAWKQEWSATPRDFASGLVRGGERREPTIGWREPSAQAWRPTGTQASQWPTSRASRRQPEESGQRSEISPCGRTKLSDELDNRFGSLGGRSCIERRLWVVLD
jgi:hypothetical protein